MKNFQLKNIKHSEFASQETNCYEASLYYKGKRIAIVSNHGHGGCDDLHIQDEAGYKAAVEEIRASNKPATPHDTAMEIRSRIRRLICMGDDGYCENDTQETDAILLEKYSDVLNIKYMDTDLESVCGDLLVSHLITKDYKKLISKRVVYFKKGSDSMWQTNCAKNKASLQSWITQLSNEPDTDIVLNTLPLAEAVERFRAA